MMSLAPIVLFVYNRPHLTLRTLQSLSLNDWANESELIIYADGPKNNASARQIESIKEVRKVIRSKQWCKNVSFVESEHNKGLANSIINGVSEVINQYGSIIVIEDDVVLSRYFLRFMNEGLEKYEDEPRVLSLGSWNYYHHDAPADTYFIRLPDTIAWATWKRAWMHFESDAHKLYQQLQKRDLMHAFNLNGNFGYEHMLKQQLEGKVNSWAIRLTATAFIHNTLTLYPSRSLSKHIGFGSDSTHVKSADYNRDLALAESPIQLEDITLVNDQSAIDAFIHFEKHIRPLKTSYKKYFVHLAKKLITTAWWKKP